MSEDYILTDEEKILVDNSRAEKKLAQLTKDYMKHLLYFTWSRLLNLLITLISALAGLIFPISMMI